MENRIKSMFSRRFDAQVSAHTTYQNIYVHTYNEYYMGLRVIFGVILVKPSAVGGFQLIWQR